MRLYVHIYVCIYNIASWSLYSSNSFCYQQNTLSSLLQCPLFPLLIWLSTNFQILVQENIYEGSLYFKSSLVPLSLSRSLPCRFWFEENRFLYESDSPTPPNVTVRNRLNCYFGNKGLAVKTNYGSHPHPLPFGSHGKLWQTPAPQKKKNTHTHNEENRVSEKKKK